MADHSVKLKYLELEGFRGVLKPLRVDFSPSFTVITGRNGSGKSTLCDGIQYALTRTITKYETKIDDGSATEKGETVSDYMWWVGDQAPANRRVTLGLENGMGVTVSITQTPEGTQLQGCESLESFLCTSDSPESPLAQLCRTTILRDEMIALESLDLSERDRYAFVRSAIGSDLLEQFDRGEAEVRKLLRKEKTTTVEEYNDARREVTLLETHLSELRSQLDPSADVSEAEEELRRALEKPSVSLEDLLEGASAAIRTRRDTLAEVEGLREQVQAYHDRPTRSRDDEEIAKSLEQQREELENRTEQIEKRIEGIQAALGNDAESDSLEENLAGLLRHGRDVGLRDGMCPLCRKDQNVEEFEEALTQLASEVEERAEERVEKRNRLTQARNEHEAVLEELGSVRTRLSTMAAERERMSNEREAILKRWSDLGGETQEVPSAEDIDAFYNTLRTELRKIESPLQTLEASKLVEQLSAQEAKLRRAQKRSDQIEERLRDVRAGLSGVTELRGGIRRAVGEVVQERLAKLEPLLQDLYRRLQPHADWTDVGYHLRGKVRRFLSLEVGDGLNPRFMFSSGQRRVLGLVFLLAVHLSTTWVRLETLIADDPVQHIDDYRALHIAELLSAVRRTDRQVICTVEDEELAKLLCRRLRAAQGAAGELLTMSYRAGAGVAVESRTTIDPLHEGILLSA